MTRYEFGVTSRWYDESLEGKKGRLVAISEAILPVDLYEKEVGSKFALQFVLTDPLVEAIRETGKPSHMDASDIIKSEFFPFNKNILLTAHMTCYAVVKTKTVRKVDE